MATLSSNKVDSTQARRWYSIGDSLYEASQFQKAISHLEKATSSLRQTGYDEAYYKCLNTLASSRIMLSQFQKAEKVVRRVIDELERHDQHHTQLAEAYGIKGYIYSNASYSDLQKAIHFYKKTLQLKKEIFGDESDEVRTYYSNISAAYFKNKNYDQAVNYSRKAVIFPIDSARTITNAHALHTLAYFYIEKGSLKKALHHYKKAFEIFKENNAKPYLMSNTLMNIGFIYRNTLEFTKAIDYHKMALNISNQHNKKHHFTPDILQNIGEIYIWLSEHKKSQKYLTRANEMYKKLGLTQKLSYNSLLNNLGSSFIEQKKYDSAHIYLRKSHKLYEKRKNGPLMTLKSMGLLYRKLNKLDSSKHFIDRYIDSARNNVSETNYHLANGFRELARLNILQNQYKKALEGIQKGLKASYPSFQWSHYKDNPKLKNHGKWEVVFNLFLLKAQSFNALATNSKTIDTAYLQHAYRAYCHAAGLIDTVHRRYESKKSHKYLYEKANQAYEGAIQTAFQLYDITKNEKYKKEAYRFFAKNKSILLLKNLQQSDAQSFAGVPDSLIHRKEELEKLISYYQSQLHGENAHKLDSSKRKLLEQHLVKTRHQFVVLKEHLQDHYPDYFKLMYAPVSHTIADLQNQFEKKDESAIDYFNGDSAYYYTFISQDTSIIGSIQKDSVFMECLSANINATANPDYPVEKFAKNSYQLYNALFDKIEAHVTTKNLNIIPAGRLVYLSFDVLVQNEPSREDLHYNTLDYMIRDFNINYAYANSLLRQKPPQQNSNSGGLVAFAPDFNDATPSITRQGIKDLKGARKEIRKLKKIADGRYFEGEEANEYRFKQEAPNYDIIHLATHAIIEDNYPMNSHLLLPSGQDTIEDGKLYTWELFNMQLNAKLAVLPACNTGRGQALTGEGAITLGRAFAYTGCPSILLSLWPVHDQVSVDLMENFYRFLQKGASKPKALRKSKLNYLSTADGITAHPFYWAGFVTIGDPSPIQEKSYLPFRPVTLIGFVALIIAVAGMLLYRYKFKYYFNK